jgi:hypothetical protein
MISASTGSTTNRGHELVAQIERCLHQPIIPENWFFCQLTLKSTQIAKNPGMITRRQSLKRLLGVAAATITAPAINRGWFQLFAESATKYSARAIDLVQRSTVVDMLNPFTLLGVLAPFKGDKRPTWFTNPETFTPADFQRFKDSRIDVMHVGVGTVDQMHTTR